MDSLLEWKTYPSQILMERILFRVYRMGIIPILKTSKMETKNKTLKEKILSGDIQENRDQAKLEKIKSEHKEAYMREYRLQYKRQKKRINITVSNDEYDRILKMAGQNNKKVSRFVKDSIIQEVDKVYLLPEDEKLENLILQIRSIGNNINQLTRHIHRSNYISKDNIKELQHSIKQIEYSVLQKFSNPDDLLSLVVESSKTNPEFVKELDNLMKR